MTMTNEEMGHCVEILSELKETGKLGYAIARNLRKMKDACMEYLNLRSELFLKYGEKLKDGKNIAVKPENLKNFLSELGDIPKIEHDVEVFTVSPEDFFGGSLTSDQMEVLLWMVQEKKEGAE